MSGRITKTSQRRVVPISDNLKAWLQLFASHTGPVLPLTNQSALYDAVREATTKSGIPWKKNALRHSFGSYREAQIRNIDQVSSEMGNAPKIMKKHYQALVSPKEAEAFWAIYPEPETIPMPTPLAVAA